MLVVFLATSAANARDLSEKRWVEVTTPNFTIYSTFRKRTTIENGEQLEVLKGLVGKLLTAKPKGNVPTLIFIAKRKDIQALVRNDSYTGVYIPGIRFNIILASAESSRPSKTLLHEYIHFLLSDTSSLVYPRWYNEGLAEYFERIHVGDEHVYVSTHNTIPFSSNPDRQELLTPIQLLDSSAYSELSDEEKGMFYFQSWLLTHYLVHAEDRPGLLNDGLTRYHALVSSGLDEQTSFSEAFKLDTATLNDRLKAYTEECCVTGTVAKDELLQPYESGYRRLSEGEASYILALAALAMGDDDRFQDWIRKAAGEDDSRHLALPYLGLASAIGNDHGLAHKQFEDAIAANPGDSVAYLNSVVYSLAKATSSADEAESEAALNTAESNLVRAWRLDKSNAETYQLAGKYYLLRDSSPDRAVEMLQQSLALAPGAKETRIALAQALAAAGRRDEAISEARTVLAYPHTGKATAEQVQQLLQELESTDDKESEPVGDH